MLGPLRASHRWSASLAFAFLILICATPASSQEQEPSAPGDSLSEESEATARVHRAGGRVGSSNSFGEAVAGSLVLGLLALLAQPDEYDLAMAAPTRRDFGSLSFVFGSAAGEFRKHVDHGIGLTGGYHHQFGRARVFGLGFDLTYLVYGSETTRVPLSLTVPRVSVQVDTNNEILMLGVGPRLSAPGALAPYITASVGLAYFRTRSCVKEPFDPFDEDDDACVFGTTHLGDLTFPAAGLGAGLRIRLGGSREVVFLELGTRYQANGRVEYLKEGSIQDHPDGSISFTPIRSQANLWLVHLGVSIRM